MRVFTISAIAGLFLAAAAANATPILVNGSFETGDFTGWTDTGNTTFDGVASGGFTYGPVDGTYFANFGAVGSDSTLSQTFSDTSGQSYNLSFWFASDGGSPADFSASIDSTTLLSIGPVVPGSGFTNYSFNFTGTGSDTLSFTNRNDPAYNYLDNISVTQAIAVPEPGTLPLFATGLLAFFLLRRRKNFAG